MSLKAYDGMMIEEDFGYLQSQLQSHLNEFEAAAKQHLAKKFAEMIVSHIDRGESITSLFKYIDVDRSTRLAEIEPLLKDTVGTEHNLLRLLVRLAKKYSLSQFRNEFTVGLTLTIEKIDNRLLVYPSVNVKTYREILVKFLKDWYAQDQTDEPEDVDPKEWKLRCEDWYKFDETRGLQTIVKIFDDTHYWNNIYEHLDFPELIELILREIPSETDRRINLMNRRFIEMRLAEMQSQQGDVSTSTAFRMMTDIHQYLKTEQGKTELENYIQSNPVEIKVIDKNMLDTYTVVIPQ